MFHGEWMPHILSSTTQCMSVFVPSLFRQGLHCKLSHFYSSLIKLFKRTLLYRFLFINSFYFDLYGKNKTKHWSPFFSSFLCSMVNVKSWSFRRGHSLVLLLQLFIFLWEKERESLLYWIKMFFWNLSLVTRNLKLLNSSKAVLSTVFNLMETFIAQLFVLPCLI